MSRDSYSERASRGQAYNLAVQTAIADGKHHDKEYVLKQFIKHLKFADLLQTASLEDLAALAEGREPEAPKRKETAQKSDDIWAQASDELL